jgi:hypothetical protein
MEVHHSHHPSHKKKWHEYMLEFLMLFLAVFLGFLAENFREHNVERHRTEQHMHTMVENLKYDTTRFGRTIRANISTANGLDSFRNQILEAIQGRVDANKLYYYSWKYGRTTHSAVTNSSAMSQLKSSGMLRMVKNDSLVSDMGDYYERSYAINETGKEWVRMRRESAIETYDLIFSFVGFDDIIKRDTIAAFEDPFRTNYIDDLLNRNPPLQLLTDNKEHLQKLYSAVATLEIVLRGYISRLRYCLEDAKSLLDYIQREYHFE